MRRLIAVLATTALVSGVSLPVAQAAQLEPTTFAELKAAAAVCADGDTLVVPSDLSGDTITVNCDLTIDLAGHTLDTDGVIVSPTNTLTIDDTAGGGTLIADGSSKEEAAGIGVTVGATLIVINGNIDATGNEIGAGIGGYGLYPGGGTVTVDGGTVTATGGSKAAGIGSSQFASGGTVTIGGGTVTATGGSQAAGIGGGVYADGGTVTIDGGTVTATGGSQAAGIGGGNFGAGGAVTIASGAVVTASAGAQVNGNQAPSAVGTGEYNGVSGLGFGSLSVAGDLYLPSSQLAIPDSMLGDEVTVTPTGRILGTVGDETIGATISGAGQIRNGGVIALDASNVTVTEHNYLVTFDTLGGTNPADVRVFATSFATGFRTFPAPPTGAVWASASDGSGTPVSASTELTGDTTFYAVSGFEAIATMAAHCTDGDTITIPGDLSGGTITVDCDLTIDLAGHTLDTTGVDVEGTNTLTIDDTVGGGTLIADSSSRLNAAGIRVPVGATLIVNNGIIDATSGDDGAGIGGINGFGGNDEGDAGTVTINGGTVTATSRIAAGIGGGWGGAGGPININGGQVTATSGGPSAGLGGSFDGAGGPVIIGEGAVVSASGGYAYDGSGKAYRTSAVGSGSEVTDSFGSLSVAGDLYLGLDGDQLGGMLRIPAGTVVDVKPTGRILGLVDDPYQGAGISGDGEIANGGVIAPLTYAVTVTVTGNNYLVSFHHDFTTAPSPYLVRVFATSFDAGFRTFPTPPGLDGWNTAADGTGDWYYGSTTLTGDTDLFMVPDANLTIIPSATSVDQGGSLTFDVTGVNNNGDPLDTTDVVLTSSVATDEVDGLTVTFPHASPHTITATLGGVTTSVTVEVNPAASELAQTGIFEDVNATLAWAAALLFAGLGITLVRGRRRA
ncbi:beta strand repeat-containing protein [Demequina aurantiaca]|uniref:beta strand repeat-containing protein n=1 Tax=Demequina aurantiaca TaxID=676200 RepID=UPI003D35984D